MHRVRPPSEQYSSGSCRIHASHTRSPRDATSTSPSSPDTPTQGTDPTAPDLLERERTSSARAERGFAEAERLYIRASHLIPDNGVDGVNAELWPVVRLNLGECCLRRGSDAEAQEYIAPVVSVMSSRSPSMLHYVFPCPTPPLVTKISPQ